MKTCYVTTPIYYASGNVHIGNSYSTIVCDVFARYHRLSGYDTFFLTGMDEHGQKIELSAKEKGKTPKQLVDEIAVATQNLWKKLKITHDDFICTSEERHKRVVQKIFSYLLAQGDIYLGIYEGDYCVQCEAFFTKTQLDEAGNCPDCHRPITKVKEESYFLKLKKYQQALLNHIKQNPMCIQPETRKNEVIAFIEQGLEDLCVSRTSFAWGIPVVENPKHVVYVWIDALSNYLSALGYFTEDDTLYQKFWKQGDRVVHVVGKDILRFHAIYWPIMLMALGVPVRFTLIAHGWLLMKEGKMSKSKDNVVYPMDVVTRYGLDALRLYLVKEMPFGNDGLFTYENFIQKFNVDLANDLGNLVSRTIAMINKYRQGLITKPSKTYFAFDDDVQKRAQATIEAYHTYFSNFQLQLGVQEIWQLIGRANKYIDETLPWALAKDPTKAEELTSVLYHLYEVLRLVGLMLLPVMPDAAQIILDELGVVEDERLLNNLMFGSTNESHVIDKPIVLFKRLDMEVELSK